MPGIFGQQPILMNRRRLSLALASLACFLLPIESTGIAAAGEPGDYSMSLHGTREGKRTYYENPIDETTGRGGFVHLTGVPYDNLKCKNCHWVLNEQKQIVGSDSPFLPDGETPYDPSNRCEDCHLEGPGSAVPNQVCFGCHSRQGAEFNFLVQEGDPHYTKNCTDCHTAAEFHSPENDGLDTLQRPEAFQASCTNSGCHAGQVHETAAVGTYHENLDCSACHVDSVVTCLSCHFETEVEQGTKAFDGPPHTGFRLLMNRNGKVHSATFQSLTWTVDDQDDTNDTFYVLAPYVSHNIKRVVSCGECHENAAIAQYNESGTMEVTQWDGKVLQGPQGVIPVPPDWESALLFDFVASPPSWTFFKSGADGVDMPFGTPLSESQMQSLGAPEPGAALLAAAALGTLAALRRRR